MIMKKVKNVMYPIKDITLNIKNPRKGQYDPQELEELQDSMESLGQITPIKIDENGLLIGGHRRVHCAKKLKWTTINADILYGLKDFEKSCIMFSDNTTQKQFNAWDSRKSINDIYWNEFCENYEFTGEHDKGYKAFSKLIGVSSTTIKKIIESMAKDNLLIIKNAETEDIGTEALDVILASPKKYRNEIFNKAVQLKKLKTDKTSNVGMREHLRMFKKGLAIKDMDVIHPSFYATIHYKINALGEALTDTLIDKTEINELLKLKKAITLKIIKPFERISKKCKNK